MTKYKKFNRYISIGFFLWTYLIIGLYVKGKRRRESGAVLLGKWMGVQGRVTKIVFFDKLNPNAYRNGIIEFDGEGQSALWELCRTLKIEIIADCHTHPSNDTNQSYTDKHNPIVPCIGHIALIIPNYGNILPWYIQGVGMYEYLGGYKWKSFKYNENPNRIRFSLF